MILITESQYFAPVILYLKLDAASHCVIDQYERFEKRSFRSRCTVAGGSGRIDLSIPVVGGRLQSTTMKDVRIDHSENWRARHWKTIQSCYNRSPWFEYFSEDLRNLYELEVDRLVEWNVKCFRWVCDKMAISTPWSFSQTYQKNYEGEEFLDLRGKLFPASVASRFPLPFTYPQVFAERHGFIQNLSVLDYLFCAGRHLPAV